MKRKFVLIRTDGYEIDAEDFNTAEEAICEMQKQYADRYPKDIDVVRKGMSYCTDKNAILYTYKEVFVWKIHQII